MYNEIGNVLLISIVSHGTCQLDLNQRHSYVLLNIYITAAAAVPIETYYMKISYCKVFIVRQRRILFVYETDP